MENKELYMIVGVVIIITSVYIGSVIGKSQQGTALCHITDESFEVFMHQLDFSISRVYLPHGDNTTMRDLKDKYEAFKPYSKIIAQSVLEDLCNQKRA